jgi:hypothetical protein
MPRVVDIRQAELDLDPVVAERCEERLKIARTHMVAVFYHWLEAGKQFRAIKQDLGTRHWAPWLREHDVARSTADVLVNVAERFDPILLVTSRTKASDLHIDFEAMRLLASPDASASAAQEAINRAGAGEHITKAVAEKMIADARREGATQAQEQSAAELARATKETEAAIAELNKAETKAATLTANLAELRASRTQELAQARAEATKQFEGKVVLTEDELRDEIARLMKPSDRRIAQLEKQLETANTRRNQAQAEIGRLRDRLKAGAPKAKPFDSNLSMKAMSVEQAIEHLRGELKLSPAECIAIEREMATRIHQRPALATEKLKRMAASIADIVPWFETFLELHAAGGSR